MVVRFWLMAQWPKEPPSVEELLELPQEFDKNLKKMWLELFHHKKITVNLIRGDNKSIKQHRFLYASGKPKPNFLVIKILKRVYMSMIRDNVPRAL